VVTKVEDNSAAAEKGLHEGDVIVEVDQQAVTTPGDVETRVKEAKDRGYRVVTLRCSVMATTSGSLRIGWTRATVKPLSASGGDTWRTSPMQRSCRDPRRADRQRKSALAPIAREFGGTVINADSFQVYRELPALTAQPAAAARGASASAAAPAAVNAAARWTRWRALRSRAPGAGRMPVVVGAPASGPSAAAGWRRSPEIWRLRGGAPSSAWRAQQAAFHAELSRRDPRCARIVNDLSAWCGRGR
jgi:hypothetical protein